VIWTRQGRSSPARVPGTIEEAKQAVEEADLEVMKPLTDGYRATALHSEYGDVRQRWLLVWSEEAEQRAIDQAANQLEREHAEEKKAFRKLKEQEFACREDAEKALSLWAEDEGGKSPTARLFCRHTFDLGLLQSSISLSDFIRPTVYHGVMSCRSASHL